MATVKLPDKPMVSATLADDSLVLVRDGAVKRIPLTLLATAADAETLAAQIRNTVTGNIHVHDIGSETFDPAAMDYSQYAAGDVILVVSDMEGA